MRSHLGILNFYGEFLVSAAAILEPLNALLRKDVHWDWKAEHSKAFQDSKTALLDACLIHFDLNLPIVVSVDISKYGLGAVLCQQKDGAELPVVFASRSLNKAERDYSQTEKEALSLTFVLKKEEQEGKRPKEQELTTKREKEPSKSPPKAETKKLP